jgi:hypothetical protein
MLAAAEGFSGSVKLPGSSNFLTNAQPSLFFLLGEHMAGQVTTTTTNTSCTIFLPEVCNIPLGMVWPTMTTFEDFYCGVPKV